MRNPLVVSALVALAVQAPLAAHADTPADPVAKGRYILVLHPTAINGHAVVTDKDVAVPMAVAIRGTTIALGGKRGPQVVGSLANGRFTATRQGSARLGQMRMEGAVSGANAMLGTFTMVTPKGNTVDGQFVSAPYGGSWNSGSGTMGKVTAPGGSSIGASGMKGTASLPAGMSLGSWSNGAGYVGGIPALSGSGPSVSYQNGVGVLQGSGAPGMAGSGPNLGNSAASGWASDDGKDPTSDAANSVSNLVDNLDYLNPKGGAPDAGNTGKKTVGPVTNADDANKSTFDKLWDWAFGNDTKKPPPPQPVKPPKPGAGNSVDDRDTYGGSGKINKGTTGGGGQDGTGSTDRGKGDQGGKNAQGQTFRGPTKGDNPFEVTGDDVLATSRLTNPASDPIFGPGVGANGAIGH